MAMHSIGQTAKVYPVDSASVVHAGVPKGEIIQFTFDKSKRFPGTTRFCWIYVPAQYKPDKPACVYVNQDGIQWNAPVVFDNLINNNEIPVLNYACHVPYDIINIFISSLFARTIPKIHKLIMTNMISYIQELYNLCDYLQINVYKDYYKEILLYISQLIVNS